MRAWSSPAIKRHWPNLGPFQPAPRDDALLPGQPRSASKAAIGWKAAPAALLKLR